MRQLGSHERKHEAWLTRKDFSRIIGRTSACCASSNVVPSRVVVFFCLKGKTHDE